VEFLLCAYIAKLSKLDYVTNYFHLNCTFYLTNSKVGDTIEIELN
jgi:hypothetical protein